MPSCGDEQHTADHDTARYRERGGHVEIRATARTTRILRLLEVHTLPRLHLADAEPA